MCCCLFVVVNAISTRSLLHKKHIYLKVSLRCVEQGVCVLGCDGIRNEVTAVPCIAWSQPCPVRGHTMVVAHTRA